MADFIIVAIVAVIIAFAARYVYKAKKSGKKCIGCPDGCSCSSNESKHNCNCGHKNSETE